jgi:hypothetical protein
VPANDVLHIKLSTNNNDIPSMIRVYDASGKLVKSEDLRFSGETQLNVSRLIPGVYALKINYGKSTLVKKLTIQH